jgi:hypothetical protein
MRRCEPRRPDADRNEFAERSKIIGRRVMVLESIRITEIYFPTEGDLRRIQREHRRGLCEDHTRWSGRFQLVVEKYGPHSIATPKATG